MENKKQVFGKTVSYKNNVKENYINKIKDLPESLRQFIGLIFITLIVIVSFSILNGIFGQGDDLVKRMKLEEERIAEEKKLK